MYPRAGLLHPNNPLPLVAPRRRLATATATATATASCRRPRPKHTTEA
jgi:hypothetical protein